MRAAACWSSPFALPEDAAEDLEGLGRLDRVTDHVPEPRQFLLLDLLERARFQSAGCPYAEALNAARTERNADGD